MSEIRSRSKHRDKKRPNLNNLDEHWPLTSSEGISDDAHMPMFVGRKHSKEDDDDIDSQLAALTPEQHHSDYYSIALLLLLYVLQGIPLGLTASIPLVLQSRKISYHEQALFSFAYWPFSLKLIWAPIVDSCYWRRLGRRKSWLVPTQYLIGAFLFILSHNVTYILGDSPGTGGKPDVLFLTGVFFALNFLAATQDVAVDGWALTMLSKPRLGYASTCNAVGQTAGWFIGNIVFLSLESVEFSNKYLRSVPKDTGVVTLAEFVYFWAFVFVITTTLVLIFKREVDHTSAAEDELDLGVVGTYRVVWKLLELSFIF